LNRYIFNFHISDDLGVPGSIGLEGLQGEKGTKGEPGLTGMYI